MEGMNSEEQATSLFMSPETSSHTISSKSTYCSVMCIIRMKSMMICSALSWYLFMGYIHN